MTEKNLNISGLITLGSRLKRLSDQLFMQVQEVYDARDSEFKASWFSILAHLKTEGQSDFKSLASRNNVSSSAISQTIKELERKEYVNVISGLDKRSRIITLTQKAKNTLDQISPALLEIETVLQEVLGEKSQLLIAILEEMEAKLREKSLIERMDLSIVTFSKEYSNQFKDLNLNWLQKDFVITQRDQMILDNPEELTVKKGGEIFLAIKDKELVGGLALIPHQDQSLEICKMAVKDEFQREGIATQLLQEAINFAKKKSYKNLFALTTTKLEPAIGFYRDRDFQEQEFSHEDYDVQRVNRKFTISI